jgi:bilirubin oxidase
MQFRAVPLTSQDYSVPPDELQLPRVPNVADNAADPGPITRTVIPACETWSNPITETPTVNVTEEWTISAVNHPIHLHQVQFDIESRNDNAPPPWEDGPKDTVQTPFLGTPKIKVRFDLPGRYVWHCHILEHEDANMMRPIEVAEQ